MFHICNLKQKHFLALHSQILWLLSECVCLLCVLIGRLQLPSVLKEKTLSLQEMWVGNRGIHIAFLSFTLNAVY